MVLRKYSTHTSHRHWQGAITKRVTLLKRNDDQEQGTVRAITLFYCRRGPIQKTDEPLQGDMTAGHTTQWFIPRSELDRTGVKWLNALDRIVETTDDGRVPIDPPRHWQPEATTQIEVKLWENWITLDCLRVDPPETA